MADDPGVGEWRVGESSVALGDDMIDDVRDAAQLQMRVHLGPPARAMQSLVPAAIIHLAQRHLAVQLGVAEDVPWRADKAVDAFEFRSHCLPVRGRPQHLAAGVLKGLKPHADALPVDLFHHHPKAAARLILKLGDGH
eukprot:3391577-Prymnesium_polylepis.1